jgi:hypothetical protein
MHFQRIFPSELPAVQMISSMYTELNLEHIEKNWSPIGEDHNSTERPLPYLFSRSLDPHLIMQCSRLGRCLDIATTNNKALFDEVYRQHELTSIQLGSNAIRLNESTFGAIVNGVLAGALQVVFCDLNISDSFCSLHHVNTIRDLVPCRLLQIKQRDSI